MSRWGKASLLALLLIGAVTLYVLNASKPGSRVEGCASSCATNTARKAGALRLVSLNMLHGFPRFTDLELRSQIIMKEIQRLDADVVLLQEVPWTVKTGNIMDRLRKELGYNGLYYRANGNKNLILFEEGEAILSRFPLSDAVTTELIPRKDMFDTRVALGATLDTPWGKLQVFVAHLTNDNLHIAEGQAESLRKFVEANQQEAALVSGDFNSQATSPQILELSNTWEDTYRVMHPGEPGLTCCIDNLHAGVNEPLEERIDYIFLVPTEAESWRLLSAVKVFDRPFELKGAWQWASDHEGLMVEIVP